MKNLLRYTQELLSSRALLIATVLLLVGCSSIKVSTSNMREFYTDTRDIISEGLNISGKLNLKKKGSYIYMQGKRSNVKYGYDYKTGIVGIRFNTSF